MTSLLLHIISLLMSGMSGYFFGNHLAHGRMIQAVVCFVCLVGTCVIAQLSWQDFRKTLDRRLEKRDNHIVERKRT